MCLIVSDESGEKAEKESPGKEQEQLKEPKKSAKKKNKKSKSKGGFQIWTELETQRNKFMVAHLYCVLVFYSELICWNNSNVTNSLISL